MQTAFALGAALLDQGRMPDFLTRWATVRLIGDRRADAMKADVEERQEAEARFISQLRKLPIAVKTECANEQHYEVPTEFFLHCLGTNLKYSCAYYRQPSCTLAQAETAMLELYCERAQLVDGMSILDMGCGWGSLCLFLAKKYPRSHLYAVSNSHTQKEHIDAAAAERGLSNVTVFTADINDFEMPEGVRVDRVMSIEMLEHMKNYERLFGKVASWLKSGGKFFAHIFTFEYASYSFESADATDWMATHFFSGGTMPSTSLLLNFQRDLALERQWKVNGMHYHRTCEHWLQNMDANEPRVRELFKATYGAGQETKWVNRWRTFYIACSEMFRYNGGDDWYVSHYLFTKR